MDQMSNICLRNGDVPQRMHSATDCFRCGVPSKLGLLIYCGVDTAVGDIREAEAIRMAAEPPHLPTRSQKVHMSIPSFKI